MIKNIPLDLRSSVSDIGGVYVTQIIHFVGGEKQNISRYRICKYTSRAVYKIQTKKRSLDNDKR